MATGDDKGHFVHFPYHGDPEPISQPNQYGALPIDDRQKLTRTLIVKIHGAVDGNRGDYEWNENYVVTEDHYIDYPSIKPITAVYRSYPGRAQTEPLSVPRVHDA